MAFCKCRHIQRCLFQVVSLDQLSPAKPQMCFLIFSKEHYLVWSTNHEVPHHPIFPILLLLPPSGKNIFFSTIFSIDVTDHVSH